MPFHEAATELAKLIVQNELQPLAYLQHQHPAVQNLGLSPEQAVELGIGYAAKGVLLGRVAFPMRDEAGKLRCYVGYGEHLKPKLKVGRIR